MSRSLVGRPVRALLAAGVALLLLAGCSTPSTGPTASVPATVITPGGSRTPASPTTTTSTPTRALSSVAPTSSAPVAPATPGFDRTAHSLDAPASIWVVVDKKRPLHPKTYIPADLVTPAVPHTNVPQLRRVASHALVTMFTAAKRDGVALYSLSAYRSYATQTSIFNRNLRQLGRATTLNLTAKPGYSEHQTGLADDLGDGTSCDLAVCFESHPAAKWLARNSWRYGWVLRYPLGYTRITGIQTEPWHFRYIGKAAAKQMHASGVKTLEQFFHLPPSPDY